MIRDYTKLFITTNNSGEIQPVTNYRNLGEVGFFIEATTKGTLRVCNDNELFVWANGRLVRSIPKGCDFLPIDQVRNTNDQLRLYLSFSSPKEFDNLRCDLVEFGDLKVVRDNVSKTRQSRNIFNEFVIVGLMLIVALFASYAGVFRSRLNFFFQRTFSLKTLSYEFTNTSFLGRANLLFLGLLCLTIGFEIIYLNQRLEALFFAIPAGLGDYLYMWLLVACAIVLFFLTKKLIIDLISRLFRIRKLREWQFFDLINFSGYFTLILFIIILWDFILKGQGSTWVTSPFSYYFVLVILLFELWFTIKFVINSTYQKLLIISYLCATEIVPSIIIMVWFLK